ncbi:MAG: nuclear transport factor 2 family protein [Planctomycetota bacterium]
MPTPQTNKLSAIDFYRMMFDEGKPREAVARYVGDTYIQHNPHVPDGPEPFIAYFEQMAVEYPAKRAVVARAVAEGDLVVLHLHHIWPNADGTTTENAVVDIFRFDAGGKIVEHWDVIQAVPSEPANKNTMF